MNWEIDAFIFKAPFTCLIAGPSQSGKTTLLGQILVENIRLIYPPPDRIVYFYSRAQPAFDELKKKVDIEFVEGLPDADMFDSSLNNLIILDDLMDKAVADKSVLNIFTVDAHHKNISTFLISQNLFVQGKYARTISLNANYMIIFNSPRDRSQILFLARQMFPTNPNFLIECFEESTKVKHGYLFVDLTQSIKNDFRVQTDVLNNEQRIIYVEKKN